MAKRNVPTPDKSVDEAGLQALIEEIDSEVKAKQAEVFLKKHGKALIAVGVAIVLGTAIGNTYMKSEFLDKEENTGALIALMDKDFSQLSDDEARATLLDMAKMGKEGKAVGHRMAARFAEAGTLLANKKNDEAVKVLEGVYGDASVPDMYRDYALLQLVRARMGKEEAGKLLTELAPLRQENNPWRLSALETAALLEAQAGDKEKALASLQQILDTVDAPSSVTERAKLLARLYHQ